MRPHVEGLVTWVVVGGLMLAGCEDPEPVKPLQTAPPTESSVPSASGLARQAERFAPLVRLTRGESHLPMAATEFLDGATLRWAHDKLCGDDEVAADVDPRKLATGGYRHQGKGHPPGCAHGGRFYDSSENTRPHGSAELGAEGFYLDGDDSQHGGTGTTAPVYWQYYRGAYVYWFFYPFNDAPPVPIGFPPIEAFDHEGDWERIAVRTDGQDNPIGVTLWGHGNSCYVRSEQLKWEADHPVVYSALGTHASYAESGIHRGGVDMTTEGPRWETWRAVRPIEDEPWYGYSGGWGSVGFGGPESNHRTGPAGPRPDQPTDAWTEHHCFEPDQLPAALRGEWRSPDPADQPSSDTTYYVHLTLTGGAVGGDVGTVDYPGLDCSGKVSLVQVDPGMVTLTETITDDPGEISCTPRGTVALTLDGDVLSLSYTLQSGEPTMTARLLRER